MIEKHLPHSVSIIYHNTNYWYWYPIVFITSFNCLVLKSMEKNDALLSSVFPHGKKGALTKPDIGFIIQKIYRLQTRHWQCVSLDHLHTKVSGYLGQAARIHWGSKFIINEIHGGGALHAARGLQVAQEAMPSEEDSQGGN